MYNDDLTRFSTITNYFDFELIPIFWMDYAEINSNFTIGELPFGMNLQDGYLYTILNQSVSTVGYGKPDEIGYSHSFDSLISIDVSDWIWPKFEQFINKWSFQPPITLLEPSYNIRIGKKIGWFKYCL